MYDRELTQEQLDYHYINHVPYHQVPVISEIDGYINCPGNFSNASFAYRALDNSMQPMITQNSHVFVDANGLVNHKEVGLFKLNDDFLIRKLYYKKEHFILKANDKKYKDITITDEDNFQIIGKIYM